MWTISPDPASPTYPMPDFRSVIIGFSMWLKSAAGSAAEKMVAASMRHHFPARSSFSPTCYSACGRICFHACSIVRRVHACVPCYMDVTTNVVQSAASARAEADPPGAAQPQPDRFDNEGQDQDLRDTPFACNVCKRSYSRVDHLARHHRSRRLSTSLPSRGQNENALSNFTNLHQAQFVTD